MFTISYVYLKEYESLSTLLLNLINFVPSLRPLFGHNLRPNGLITVMFLSFRLTYNETPLCYTAELWQQNLVRNLTQVSIWKIPAFRVCTPHRLTHSYWRFERSWCLPNIGLYLPVDKTSYSKRIQLSITAVRTPNVVNTFVPV